MIVIASFPIYSFGWRLVNVQPVKSHSLNGPPKLFEIDRFLNVAVDTQPVALHAVVFLPGRCQRHHRDGARLRVVLYLAKNLQAVDLGQFQIRQNQLGRMSCGAIRICTPAEQKIQSFFSIARHFNERIRLLDLELAYRKTRSFEP
jgi:hypothetical protein